jgi:hypothetical protein
MNEVDRDGFQSGSKQLSSERFLSNVIASLKALPEDAFRSTKVLPDKLCVHGVCFSMVQ